MNANNQDLLARPELINLIVNQTNTINYSIFGYNAASEGWVDLDKKVASSFEAIKNNSIIEDNISFISFADTELNADKVDLWEVEADKGKFFYEFCEKIDEDLDSEQINDYYFFKYVLSKTMEGGTEVERKLLANPKSAQLAYVLEKPFVYKISCASLDDAELTYDKNLLTVRIPQVWFEFTSNSIVEDNILTIDYHPVIFDKNHCVYKIGEKSIDIKSYNSSYAEICKLKEYILTLSDLLEQQNVPIKSNKFCLEGFARLLLSLAYLAKKKDCCVESIPGVVAEKGEIERCLGVFIWGYKGDISPYTPYFNLLADKLCICYAAKYIEPLKYVEKVRNASIKSAKAAIMSRNMSHNIGSHVMAYLKQHLSSVTNILQDNILSDLMSSSDYSKLQENIEKAKQARASSVEFNKVISTNEGGLALPFLVGLGNFMSYLQERQDFIATIATDYIPYYSTVNFKDFIYDEINPDKRFLRHRENTNLQLRPDNILLGNIARSEGLGRTISPTEKANGKLSDIVIKFRGFDGNSVVNDGNDVLDGRLDAFKDLEFMRQIDVSLPGGMVGRQAIFSMLENIIRNAAKHGNWRSQGRLELTFDFIDKEALEEYGHLITRRFELETIKEERQLTEEEQSKYKDIIEELTERDKDAAQIVDRDADPLGGRKTHKSLMRVLWQFYSKSLDADDLYFVTITDNINISEDDIYKLREALTEGYIDNESRMIEANKGIKEIRISAAWLRGAKDEKEYFNEVPKDDTVAQTDKKAPLLYIRQHYCHLQYIFCLLIPKRVAVISESFDNDNKLNDNAKKILAKSYWKAFTPSAYIEENNKSYNFVLCDGEGCYNKIRPYSPSRIVTMSSIEDINRDNLLECVKDGTSQNECNRIETCLYQYFAKSEIGKEDIICVDDKKAYARLRNQSTTIHYIWDEESECFIRSEGTKQDKVVATDRIHFDGLALIPKHDYCKVGNVIITDGGGFGEYVYRTHHDMNEEFNRFMGDLRNNFNGCHFVESITGNSSTDRLVRNDSLDDRWFYSHLRAMKQQVAIFDERLFSKLYGLEEVDFTRANAASGTLDDMKKQYISQFGLGPKFAKEINECKSIDELNDYILSHNALKRKLYVSEVDAKSRNVSVHYQKGIYVYTFVRNPHNKQTYGMYGLQLDPTRTDVLDAIEKVNHPKTVKLVDLSWENGSLKITPEPSTEYPAKQFDYISIHQGLLDKLYEAFEIKDKEKEKEELTWQLYLFLKKPYKDQKVVVITTKKDGSTTQEGYPYDKWAEITIKNDSSTDKKQLYMPGIMVHSGRSKPNKKDMPQLMPFIQYAAIEHATLDCKYSLVELLDSARYE